jgi:hypothetical protein
MDIDDETDFELLDIQDQADEVGKLTPREFAKLVGIAPQLVYYYIRSGQLEIENCICGRKVVDVKKAQAVVDDKRKKKGIVNVEPDA